MGMDKVVEFDKLLVRKNELYVDSPFTDYHAVIGSNEKNEELGTIVDKVDEIYHEIKESEFPPSFVHLVLLNQHEPKVKVMLHIGSAGYIWVPKQKLRLSGDEELTERLKNIAVGLAYQSNVHRASSAKLFDNKSYEIFDVDTVTAEIYRDPYDKQLYLGWNAERIKVTDEEI